MNPTNRAAPATGAAPRIPAKVADCPQSRPGPPTDLVAMPPNLWRVFVEAYGAGFSIGVDRGRELADEDAAAIHRRAVTVVRAMAGIDPYKVRQARAVGRR